MKEISKVGERDSINGTETQYCMSYIFAERVVMLPVCASIAERRMRRLFLLFLFNPIR